MDSIVKVNLDQALAIAATQIITTDENGQPNARATGEFFLSTDGQTVAYTMAGISPPAEETQEPESSEEEQDAPVDGNEVH